MYILPNIHLKMWLASYPTSLSSIVPGWNGGKALPLGGSFGEYSLNDLDEQPTREREKTSLNKWHASEVKCNFICTQSSFASKQREFDLWFALKRVTRQCLIDNGKMYFEFKQLEFQNTFFIKCEIVDWADLLFQHSQTQYHVTTWHWVDLLLTLRTAHPPLILLLLTPACLAVPFYHKPQAQFFSTKKQRLID